MAQGFDTSKLSNKMQEARGKFKYHDHSESALFPSLDDFTMTELMNLVDELTHEEQQKVMAEEGFDEKQEGEIDTSGKNDDDNKSHLALFDKLQAKEDSELDDSCSSIKSSNSFRSVSTRKVKGTILN